MEFFQNALNLRKYVTFRLLKDFGIKDKVRDRKFLMETVNLSDQEKATLGDLLDKCSNVKICDEYPEWFISTERLAVFNILENLLANIVAANSIYICSPSTADERRNFQDLAIGNCENLIQELNYIIEVIPTVNANKLTPLIEMTEREIALLKAWRKSDNKKRSQAKSELRSVYSQWNFCNANNDGNAGNNNASNVNGLRPDFAPSGSLLTKDNMAQKGVCEPDDQLIK